MKTTVRRGAVRKGLTDLIKRIQELREEPAVTQEITESLRLQLNGKASDLDECNRQIFAELPEDVTEAEYEAEYKSVSDYEEKIAAARSALSDLERKMTSPAAGATVASPPPPSTAALNMVSRAVPKVKCETFDGLDITKWVSFWDYFQAHIHDNNAVPTIDKFLLLKQCLRGAAATAIAGIETTVANYDTAVAMLKQRYDNRSLIVDRLVLNLLSVSSVHSADNVAALRRLHDQIDSSLRQLESLGRSSTELTSMFFPVLLRSLPRELVLQFQRVDSTREGGSSSDRDSENGSTSGTSGDYSASTDLGGNRRDKLRNLLDFLRVEVEHREVCESIAGLNTSEKQRHDKKQQSASSYPRKYNGRSGQKEQHYTSMQTGLKASACLFCKGEHSSHECIGRLDVAQRKEVLKKAKLCFRCFESNHPSRYCRASGVQCKRCNKKSHYTAMHDESLVKPPEPVSHVSSGCVARVHTNQGEQKSLSRTVSANVILQTASVWVKSKNGSRLKLRVMMDSGSQSTFIRADTAKKLDAANVGTRNITISTFGRRDTISRVMPRLELSLENEKADACVRIQAFSTPHVCTYTIAPVEPKVISLLEKKGIILSDKEMLDIKDPTTVEIDLIVGADYYWSVVSHEVQPVTDTLRAARTIFGHVLLGQLSHDAAAALTSVAINSVFLQVASSENPEEEFPLEAFWELEHIGIKDPVTEQQHPIMYNSAVVRRTRETIAKDEDRYSIALPWKEDIGSLPDNKEVAAIRLHHLVRRLGSKQEQFDTYDTAIMNYIKDGHAELVPLGQVNPSDGRRVYYMPHKAVIRKEKSTTRVRIVFDASAHAKGSPSLNDQLEPGPNLNPDLLCVLLRFRDRPTVITGDIAKAFLMVKLKEEERDVFRFVWVERSEGDPTAYALNHYRMTRLPFGATSSPFLLALTIRHHTSAYVSEYPVAVRALHEDLYVDDLITGADSPAEALAIKIGAQRVLADAGMHMRKWRSSDPVLDEQFTSEEDCEAATPKLFKVLGISWDVPTDSIRFDISPVQEFLQHHREALTTKRLVLKTFSRIFDPIGFLSPITIRCKVLFQDLWKNEVSWDEVIDGELMERFKEWSSELHNVDEIKLPRFTGRADKKSEIHLFCDASISAYGTSAYLRTTNSDGTISTRLILAKARVAPVKTLTIPRLELMGAVLAVRLKQHITTALNNPGCRFVLWTDSEIVLHWIRNEHKTLKQFVHNRVEEIRSGTSPNDWHYVPSADNPADVASRGLSPKQLAGCTIWWNGPHWLEMSPNNWPSRDPHSTTDEPKECTAESKKLSVTTKVNYVADVEPALDFEKYSDANKVLRVVAYVLRFRHNAATYRTKEKRISGPITSKELVNAEKVLVRQIQQQTLGEDIAALRHAANVSPKSALYQFKPFMDIESMLRIGGRLQFATSLSYDEVHPIVLPNHHFTEQLIDSEHRRLHHTSVQDTLAALRTRYWIPKGRQLVRKVINRCITCRKETAQAAKQCTAPLPRDRVDSADPFEITGVDFAGPLYVKSATGKQKAYIALFTCAVTRAVHLELVHDMTTRSFMMALRRFIARRGTPHTIYSDNALTFKRASKDLTQLMDSAIIQRDAAKRRINWRFNVDRAPWWGGFWERLVRTVKVCLRRVLGKSFLTFEELTTVIAQVEGIVNSRPLTYVSNAANEPAPLTPGHFLIGRPIVQLPNARQQPEATATKADVTRLWHRREQIVSHFWRRWTREYLLQLRSAHSHKHPTAQKNLQVGDTVIVHSHNSPRQHWPLGTIAEAYLGRDNNTRSCLVRLQNGTEVKRPVQLLYPIEL